MLFWRGKLATATHVTGLLSWVMLTDMHTTVHDDAVHSINIDVKTIVDAYHFVFVLFVFFRPSTQVGMSGFWHIIIIHVGFNAIEWVIKDVWR